MATQQMENNAAFHKHFNSYGTIFHLNHCENQDYWTSTEYTCMNVHKCMRVHMQEYGHTHTLSLSLCLSIKIHNHLTPLKSQAYFIILLQKLKCG